MTETHGDGCSHDYFVPSWCMSYKIYFSNKNTCWEHVKPLRKINRQLKEQRKGTFWHLGCYLLRGFSYYQSISDGWGDFCWGWMDSDQLSNTSGARGEVRNIYPIILYISKKMLEEKKRMETQWSPTLWHCRSFESWLPGSSLIVLWNEANPLHKYKNIHK